MSDLSQLPQHRLFRVLKRRLLDAGFGEKDARCRAERLTGRAMREADKVYEKYANASIENLKGRKDERDV